MPAHGSRALTNAALALAMAGVVASALVTWFFSGLTFFGEPLHRDDYLAMSLGFACAAGLLLLSIPAMVRLRRGGGTVSFLLVLAGLCGLAALSAWSSMADASPSEYAEEWWSGPQLFFLVPTTWPMVVLVLATPWIREPSPREPR